MTTDDTAARLAEAARNQRPNPDAERALAELFEEIALRRARRGLPPERHGR